MRLSEPGKTVATVERLVAPTAAEMGLSVWDVTFEKEGADWILRIIVDREALDLIVCEAFLRAINPLLDEADPIEQSYSLEVCSPGANRVLTRSAHFERYLGAAVTARSIRPVEGAESRDFAGTLTACGDGLVTIQTATGERVFPLAELAFVKLDDFDEGSI